MKGQITFSMPKGREEAVEQTIVGQGAKESPSELTFLPKEHPAYLTGKFKIKLASGKAWSFKKKKKNTRSAVVAPAPVERW